MPKLSARRGLHESSEFEIRENVCSLWFLRLGDVLSDKLVNAPIETYGRPGRLACPAGASDQMPKFFVSSILKSVVCGFVLVLKRATVLYCYRYWHIIVAYCSQNLHMCDMHFKLLQLNLDNSGWWSLVQAGSCHESVSRICVPLFWQCYCCGSGIWIMPVYIPLIQPCPWMSTLIEVLRF